MSLKLNLNNNLAIRITVDEVEIYEAIRQNSSWKQWKQLLNNKKINWLPKPSIYTQNKNIHFESWFTLKGFILFNLLTAPLFKRILPKTCGQSKSQT